MHLQESTELDVERDQFRAMLAGEYWRQRRFGEAKAEFERIVARGLSHLHVAQTMLEEIRRVIDTEALDGAKSSDGP
jgi:hypothetical protein